MKKKVNILLIIILELCCSYCLYKNPHSQHKILELSNENSLIKENITIESSTEEFNDMIKQLNNLKNKIENEIIEIDKMYDNINNKLSKTFELKIEILKNEEKNLRDNLQNEVTIVKEIAVICGIH